MNAVPMIPTEFLDLRETIKKHHCFHCLPSSHLGVIEKKKISSEAKAFNVINISYITGVLFITTELLSKSEESHSMC